MIFYLTIKSKFLTNENHIGMASFFSKAKGHLTGSLLQASAIKGWNSIKLQRQFLRGCMTRPVGHHGQDAEPGHLDL